MALVFRSIAEPLQLDPEEFFGVNEWANFQQAVKTRHRITHPKSEKDLTITHPDMIEIRHALWWFFEAMRKIAVASIQNQAEQAGAGQPATRAVVEPEGGDKPQTEAEGRSR